MIYKTKDELPDIKTPVNIYVDGKWNIGQLLWQIPHLYETWDSYLYWGDIYGEDIWEWYSVTHWSPLPDTPEKLTYDELEEWINPFSTGIIIY